MSVTRAKFVFLLLIVGVLAACASQTATPAATEDLSPATEAATATPAGESPTSAPVAATTVSFANDILPIFESRCVNCHGGDRTEEGLSLKTYADTMKGSKDGAVIVPGDADHSKLAELVITQKMPKRGPKLTPTQIQLIVDWINQGALDN